MPSRPSAQHGRVGERTRSEAVLRTWPTTRVTARLRYLAAVAREPRFAGPPVSLGRRASVVFGTRGVVRRGPGLVLGDGFSALIDGELTIGRDVFLNRDANLSVYGSVSIGDRCRFGERLSIHDEDHVVGSSDAEPADYVVDDIVIGDDVWVGANVTILRGSNIGSGAVVAAGAVVRGEVPPGALAGGVPAHVLRTTT